MDHLTLESLIPPPPIGQGMHVSAHLPKAHLKITLRLRSCQNFHPKVIMWLDNSSKVQL